MAQFPIKQDPPVPYSAPTVTQKAALEATWLAETLAGGASVGGDRTVADWREAHIRERAYFKGAQRGFAPGREVEDWPLRHLPRN